MAGIGAGAQAPEPSVEQILRKVVPASEWEDPRLDLRRTPARVARAFQEDMLAGYQLEKELVFTTFPVPEGEEQALVFEGPIQFVSVCSHHLLPITGTAYVSYIPEELIVGASKLARVVDIFARRLQIQERLVKQIASYLDEHLQPRFVAVTLRASHACMSARGVRQHAAQLITTSVLPSVNVVEGTRGALEEHLSLLSLATRT